jgi:hypothetical protein
VASTPALFLGHLLSATRGGKYLNEYKAKQGMTAVQIYICSIRVSSSAYIFVAWCLIKHQGQLYLLCVYTIPSYVSDKLKVVALRRASICGLWPSGL